ncbi:hypothetical protein D9M69_676410 [compost metagenome]
MLVRLLEDGRGELVQLRLGNDLVYTAATLLADADATHERSQHLVAAAWWAIEKALRVHQRHARIGDFHAPLEQLDHRPGTTQVEVLVDDGIGDQLTQG